MPEQDPARRAVVTGLGAIMPIGNDFPTYWSNLVAGVTGTRSIQSFDASAHEVRIAAEVLDFDPREHMDAKMARRMSRFIHFAMAAGKEAVADSGIDFAAMSQDSATGSASSSTRAAAASSRSSTGRTSTTARVPGSSPRSPCPPCRAPWARRCCRWSGASPAP